MLDDVTPLRQMDARDPAPAHLFAPAATVRVRPAGFTGTPLPKDEPMAANPPAGASIDYVLNGPAAGPVVIRIADAEGRTVREYSSEDRLPATDLTTIRVAPEWILPPSPPARTPGMHRFVWPIRYPAPAALADGNPYADGVWAPPGRYTVELSVGQSQRTQPLTILPDPRVTMTPEAYARQFALARRIEAAAARVAEAVTALDTVHKRLAGGGAADLDLRVQALLGPDFEVGWSPRRRRAHAAAHARRQAQAIPGRRGRCGRAAFAGRRGRIHADRAGGGGLPRRLQDTPDAGAVHAPALSP